MKISVTNRFSFFKFVVGFSFIYWGLKALHLLPQDVTMFIDNLVSGFLGNIWGLLLVFLGVFFLVRSLTYRTVFINTRRFYDKNNEE